MVALKELERKRTAARLAAVQALYSIDVGLKSLSDAIAFTRFLGGAILPDQVTVAIDFPLFERIVEGVCAHKEPIAEKLKQAIVTDRTLTSHNLLVQNILRAGCYEICYAKDIDAPLTIHEYVTVSKSFFDTKEPGFINGLLDNVAKQERQNLLD